MGQGARREISAGLLGELVAGSLDTCTAVVGCHLGKALVGLVEEEARDAAEDGEKCNGFHGG